MTELDGKAVEPETIKALLAAHFQVLASELELIGQGAWSHCFGLRQKEQDLALRFGQHIEDFYKDARAYQYATMDLPIPEVFELGELEAGYYAVSSRVYGQPLESLAVSAWQANCGSLAAALEAMRLADLSKTAGYGGWDQAGQGEFESWSAYLLGVAEDSPSQRIYGWQAKLARYPETSVFDWGYELLKQVAADNAARSLIHADLINRNVLVKDQRLSGVFDWGCSLYGDHLYDLAWLEFWSPWHPNMDLTALRQELERLWYQNGYQPENLEARLLAAHLHIGLSHLSYNAYFDRVDDLSATAKRMQTLAAFV